MKPWLLGDPENLIPNLLDDESAIKFLPGSEQSLWKIENKHILNKLLRKHICPLKPIQISCNQLQLRNGAVHCIF